MISVNNFVTNSLEQRSHRCCLFHDNRIHKEMVKIVNCQHHTKQIIHGLGFYPVNNVDGQWEMRLRNIALCFVDCFRSRSPP